jgi:DNA-binding NarL/FixJ family response regulator
LIDEILDGGSGSSLVSELRTAESPCCAVMITGSSRTEAARRALAAGAEGFLLKPVQDDMLMDSLRRTVERTRQWRAQVDGVEWDNDFPAPPHLWVVAPVPTDSVPKGPKLVAWPPLRTLGALDIERCADAIAEIGGLTDRERRILVPLLRGEQNPEIARSAGVTARTVKFHVSNILKKLRLTARAEIVRFFF